MKDRLPNTHARTHARARTHAHAHTHTHTIITVVLLCGQLGLEQPSYSLSMVALSDRPQGSSVESTVVDLLTAPFHPFSYYCYHNIHSKGQK